MRDDQGEYEYKCQSEFFGDIEEFENCLADPVHSSSGGDLLVRDVDARSKPAVRRPLETTSRSAGQAVVKSLGELPRSTRSAQADRIVPTACSSGPPPSACDGTSDMEAWLRGLDGGKGGLLRYLDAMQREFDDFEQLTGVVLDRSASLLKAVDPVVFEALGVAPLGHKLLLARGILAIPN